MATYVTDDEVLKAVARRLGTLPDLVVASSSWWAELAAEANQDAYQHLRSTLVGQGYTVATIDAWDDRARWNRRIAVCLCLRAGAVAKAYDLEAVGLECKCLDELATVTITVAGELVQPDAPAAANIGYGMGPTGIETLDLDLAADLD